MTRLTDSSSASRRRGPSRPGRRSRNLVLFLAASPSGTSRISLDRECAAIERELRMTASRDDFDLCSRWAVTVDDMARHLLELQPTILHFSGHGAPGAAAGGEPPGMLRDVSGALPAEPGGIYLQNEHGDAHVVPPRALRRVIQSSAASIRLMVLNACYTDTQADEMCLAVDCTVGMTGAIRDDAARSFAVGFYRALGNNCSVGQAMEHGTAMLLAKHDPGEQLPQCRTRDGVDANQIMLAPP